MGLVKREIQYNFVTISNCNMCNAPVDDHKILGKRLNKSQGFFPEKKTGITTTICKCTNCGLIYSNPQPIPANIQDHYGVPPEQYWTPDYFNVEDSYFAGEIKIMKRLIGELNGLKSLDIGAGIGKQMIALQKQGMDTYGLEPSEPFYDRAISKMGINKERLKFGMVEELDYPENFFDFISFGVVLEHLYSPAEAIEKAMRWLKPGGIIHIEVPSSDWLINKLINLAYKVRFKDYVGNLSPMHTPFHLYEFGLKSFRQHAAQHKYEVLYHEYYVCNTLLPQPFAALAAQYMELTKTGMQLCVWLKKS